MNATQKQIARDRRQAVEKNPPAKDIDSIAFDPNATELRTAWYSRADEVLCLNTYPNGITLSSHRLRGSSRGGAKEVEAASSKEELIPGHFHLRFRDTRDYLTPPGKYFLYKEDYADRLTRHLAQLRKSGRLTRTVVYFGVMTDPFLSLSKKFDVTMACLDILERYRPGFLVIQTRSPMVIASLAQLKMFRERVVVSIPIETRLEAVVTRYTPGQPRIAERGTRRRWTSPSGYQGEPRCRAPSSLRRVLPGCMGVRGATR